LKKLAEVTKQFWQERIIADIMNSPDSTYDKEYTLPRGSGVSTLFLRLIREFSIVFAEEDIQVLMIVPTNNHKRYVQSFLSNPNSVLMAKLGMTNGMEATVTVVSATDNEMEIAGKFASHVDWLFVDNVPEDNVIVSYLKNLQINNRLVIQTI
jgi:hypothetical protein